MKLMLLDVNAVESARSSINLATESVEKIDVGHGRSLLRWRSATEMTGGQNLIDFHRSNSGRKGPVIGNRSDRSRRRRRGRGD